MVNDKINYRRNGKKIYIKQPELSEMEFVSKLWSDEDTMRDIGGVYDISEEKWERFYNSMIKAEDKKNFYCLIYTVDEDKPVGEVSFHGYDCVTKSARFNIKILYSERRKGYGEEAFNLLLEYYFFEFGGRMVIDNVTTREGFNLVKKFGFEVTGQYNEEIGIRLTKENFSHKVITEEKKVGIFVYDNMELFDYALVEKILTIANEINGKKIFDISNISINSKINIDSNVVLYNNVDKKQWDIIILPGSKCIVDSELNSSYIQDNIRSSEYICAQGKAIKFLIASNVLEGIFVPKNQVDDEDSKYIPTRRLIDKPFVDNGKVMLSSNIMGQMELMLRLVDKIGGIKLAKDVGKAIGVNYE
ncbi:GNAT family N-acetyltransferase [Clostridium sp. MSJ-8]|uniref:GNAT family N-acetyltransferase n=1 Tax=Clostridium sp. MSJ-8 TaxID=2841510 RepID=UPI001C0F0B3B|nr:GNAT family N-acetyltransferase [Clostridium sp. MSJ-8]MBU5487158.1 GNAT family N-acetyltransferase [Clostridium sp. MSJ-8]